MLAMYDLLCTFPDMEVNSSSRPVNPPYLSGHPSPMPRLESPAHAGLLVQNPSPYISLDRGGTGPRMETSMSQHPQWSTSSSLNHGSIGPVSVSSPGQILQDSGSRIRTSPDRFAWDIEPPSSRGSSEFVRDSPLSHGSGSRPRSEGKGHSQRRPSNRDEFDGPSQFLEKPPTDVVAAQERELPHVPTNLYVQEQDDVLSQVNDRLSQCAFDFVAKYQFPIPLEPDKRPVRVPADREWTEWVYLLKRLATKRRIPARLLYNGQIKQLVTVLENSMEMRHAAKHQSRPLKDDRNVLQLISAGIQVAKLLRDAECMASLDKLYLQTEIVIQNRRKSLGYHG